jgi:hypothetical protein
MIVTIDPDAKRKMRIWCWELPDTRYAPISTISTSIKVTKEKVPTIEQIAVELLVRTGPRSLYGLLGAHFTPRDNKSLEMEVAISDRIGPQFSDSLAGHSDDVRVGLPDEYAGAVLEGAAMLAKEESQLSGQILFCCAAHGRVGSSAAIFEQLSKMVVSLMFSQEPRLLQDRIKALLRAKTI